MARTAGCHPSPSPPLGHRGRGRRSRTEEVRREWKGGGGGEKK